MISYTTFSDAIDHGIDYLGGNPSDQARRDCVRAAVEAYRDIANAFNWSYLYTQGRVITNPAFDGSENNCTIQFQQTGGTYPLQVTLTGGTWPSWAGQGYIRAGTTGLFPSYIPVTGDVDTTTSFVAFKVAEMKSATVLTLDPVINPGIDLPAGTPFILYCDTYLLPEDYISQDQALYERNFGGMSYTHPREWLYENRYVFAQGVPMAYTITGDQKWPGRMVIRVYPWPYEFRTIDYIYKRRPRPLYVPLITGGTVAIAANTNALMGTGTNFNVSQVGSVVRLSGTGTKPPSSLIMGSNPAVFETVITDWISATQVNLQDASVQAYSGVQYTISDSIDIEAGAMMNAYLRCVEKHIGMSRTLKDKPSAAKQYLEALAEAKSADSRSFTGRSVNQAGPMRRRLRDYPIDLSHTT